MRLALKLCLACFLLLCPHPVVSQTRTLDVTPYPITIEFELRDDKVASEVASIARGAIPVLIEQLGLDSVQPFRIVLIGDMDAFERQNGVRLPSWGIAFALMEQQIMLVDVARATSAWNSLRKVIPHELSHLLVAQRVNGARLPVWFVEGLAQWQAHEWSMFDSWQLMEAVWSQRALSLSRLVDRLPGDERRVRDSYRVAYTAFIERFDKEPERVKTFLGELAANGDFSSTFAAHWGERDQIYYQRFDQELHRRYRSRLLLFQTGPLFSVVAVLFFFVYLRTKLRNRRRLKKLEQIDRGVTFDDI